GGAESGFGGWIYTYALKMGLGTETSSAYLNSAFWGALMFGRLVAIPLSAKVNARWLLLADLAGTLLGVGLILAAPQSPAALWAGAMLAGVSMASLFPLSLSLAREWMTITGQVNRWFFFGANLGGMAFPWLIGQMFEPLGPRSAMVTILAGMLGALVVFGVTMRRVAKTSG
ncbi:MAG TPA: hypothetical protein VHO48_04400, partial [Anaerolineaceae bacterium]|nr:hypothetical protein [Anaerolineaceae bacterium]